MVCIIERVLGSYGADEDGEVGHGRNMARIAPAGEIKKATDLASYKAITKAGAYRETLICQSPSW